MTSTSTVPKFKRIHGKIDIIRENVFSGKMIKPKNCTVTYNYYERKNYYLLKYNKNDKRGPCSSPYTRTHKKTSRFDRLDHIIEHNEDSIDL